MELKASLVQPYTIRQRADFIFQNQCLGYEIRDSKEVPGTIEAWGYTEEEIAERERQAEIDEEITHLKQLLADSDYEAIKYAEGWLSEEDYAPIKAQRESWRARIRELENN